MPDPRGLACASMTRTSSQRLRYDPDLPLTCVRCVCRYMVVGFEVVPCSIHRNPGARLDDIPCPMSPDDPDAPKPMEVVKGAHMTSVTERRH